MQQGPILFLAPKVERVSLSEMPGKPNMAGRTAITFFTRSASFGLSSDDDLRFLRDKFGISEFAPKAVFFDTLDKAWVTTAKTPGCGKVARYLNDLKSEFNCAFLG